MHTKFLSVFALPLCLALASGAGYANEKKQAGDAAEAIRQTDARWSEDLYAGRLDAVMQNYDDDAAFLTNNSPIIRGKAAIRAWFAERLATPGYSAKFKPNEIVVAEAKDMAYELGEFEATAMSNGQLVRVKGKHLVTWKWNGSRWVVTAEAISTDGPPRS